jgi:RNA polymerase sigma-70 factor, ECF subfamily
MTTTSVDAGRTAGAALSDEDIVRRVCAGESGLFEILMRRHNQRIFRVARAILRDEAEAEDVMQQAYVNAFTHLHQFADRSLFVTWLTRIAMYEAFARRRRRGRLAEIEAMSQDARGRAAMTSAGPDPERQAFSGELRRALEASLDALPDMYRCVFVMREVEGLSTAETAHCLEVSEDVVKTRLLRARGLLRRALMEQAGLAARDLFPFPAPRCNRVVAAVLARLGVTTVH